MDSDDILELDALELLYNRAERDQLDVIYFNAFTFSEEEDMADEVERFNNYYIRRHGYPEAYYEGSELMEEMLVWKEYLPSACLQFTKREHLLCTNNWFINGIVHEDEFFTFKNMLTAKRAGYINRAFFRRRMRSASIMSTKKTFKNAYGCFISYLKMDALIHEEELSSQALSVAFSMMNRELVAASNAFGALEEDAKYTVMGLSHDERVLFAMYVAEKDAEHRKVLALKLHMEKARENSVIARQKIEKAWEMNAHQKKRLEQAWEINTQNKRKFAEQTDLMRERLNKAWDAHRLTREKLQDAWERNKQLREKLEVAWETNKQAKEKLRAAWENNKQLKEKLGAAWETNKQAKEKLQAAWENNKQLKEKLEDAWETNKQTKGRLQAAWENNKQLKKKLENAQDLNAQMRLQIEQLKKKNN